MVNESIFRITETCLSRHSESSGEAFAEIKQGFVTRLIFLSRGKLSSRHTDISDMYFGRVCKTQDGTNFIIKGEFQID